MSKALGGFILGYCVCAFIHAQRDAYIIRTYLSDPSNEAFEYGTNIGEQ